jgi:hypothetical protein
MLPALTGYKSPNQLKCKWLQVVTPPSNTSQVDFGGVEVAHTDSPLVDVGLPIPAGWSGQMLPPIAELFEFYDLSTMYVYVAAGDVVYFLYA